MGAFALSLLLPTLLSVVRSQNIGAIFPVQVVGTTQQAPSVCPGSCRCGVLNTAQARAADGALARRKRFVGGETVTNNLYPWLVTITRMPPYRGFSTGALVSDRHVLTSSSAVSGVPSTALRVTLSVSAMCAQEDRRAMNVSVQNVVQRAGDATVDGGDDLALLRLASPLRFSPWLRPVCLPPTLTSTYNGVMATVLGFGGNATEALDASSTTTNGSTTGFLERCRPRSLRLAVVPPAQCSSVNPATTGCVGSPGAPQIVCSSDTGSLVQVPGARREVQLIGVITNTNNCTASETGAAQFTRTAPNLRWLLANTADGCFCAAP